MLVLIIILIIVLILILKLLGKQDSNAQSDALNDSVMTLTRIVVKIASKHFESGLLSVNERYGEYVAVFRHIDSYQMEGVLDSYIGLTPSEISFLMSHSKIERNDATIRIEIGHSDITYNAVMDLLASNKSVFSKIETAKDGCEHYYFR